jgi:hypothetical protein
LDNDVDNHLSLSLCLMSSNMLIILHICICDQSGSGLQTCRQHINIPFQHNCWFHGTERLTRRKAYDVLTYDAVWSTVTAWNTVTIISGSDIVIMRKRRCCRDVVNEEIPFTNMVVLIYFRIN